MTSQPHMPANSRILSELPTPASPQCLCLRRPGAHAALLRGHRGIAAGGDVDRAGPIARLSRTGDFVRPHLLRDWRRRSPGLLPVRRPRRRRQVQGAAAAVLCAPGPGGERDDPERDQAAPHRREHSRARTRSRLLQVDLRVRSRRIDRGVHRRSGQCRGDRRLAARDRPRLAEAVDGRRQDRQQRVPFARVQVRPPPVERH